MTCEMVEMLHLELEPVGVFLGNEGASCDLDASPGNRNCIVPLLLSAARGKTVSVDDKACNCPGGTVGCCFGDGFTRKNPNIHKMLSLWEDLGKDLEKSCLTTHAWKKVEERLV